MEKACNELGLSLRTFQRWVGDGGEVSADRRTTAERPEPCNKLSEAERQQILELANSEEFASLPPSQIVPRLADRGVYLASTGPTIRAGPSAAWRKREPGRYSSCAGTTMSTSGIAR